MSEPLRCRTAILMVQSSQFPPVSSKRWASPSHGENRGSSPLGSANEINQLMQSRQLVSNDCPINVYGQAWTACRFLDWTTCAVRVPKISTPTLSAPGFSRVETSAHYAVPTRERGK